MTLTTSRRRAAIAHARRTTGTILWSSTGSVYSGDGRRALDSTKSHGPTNETRQFLAESCRRFTQQEQIAAHYRICHQRMRCERLAKLALDDGKYGTARRLCEIAEHLYDEARDLVRGKRVMYRILEGK